MNKEIFNKEELTKYFQDIYKLTCYPRLFWKDVINNSQITFLHSIVFLIISAVALNLLSFYFSDKEGVAYFDLKLSIFIFFYYLFLSILAFLSFKLFRIVISKEIIFKSFAYLASIATLGVCLFFYIGVEIISKSHPYAKEHFLSSFRTSEIVFIESNNSKEEVRRVINFLDQTLDRENPSLEEKTYKFALNIIEDKKIFEQNKNESMYHEAFEFFYEKLEPIADRIITTLEDKEKKSKDKIFTIISAFYIEVGTVLIGTSSIILAIDKDVTKSNFYLTGMVVILFGFIYFLFHAVIFWNTLANHLIDVNKVYFFCSFIFFFAINFLFGLFINL